MTVEHFNTQMNRLVETFGKQAYGAERAKLIWREVSQLENQWFERTVDEFVGSLRHPPLLPEFREAAAKERERMRDVEKVRYRNEAHEFHTSYSSDQTQSMIKSILVAIKGHPGGGQA